MPDAPTPLEPVVPPGEETSAPGPLGVVEAFLNTVELSDDGERETLPDADTATLWLRRYRLLAGDDELGEAEGLARLRDLRASLRALALANHDGSPAPVGASSLLAAEAGRVPLRIEFEGATAPRLRPTARGTDAAIGGLLVLVFDAMRDGSWQRLKACRNATCQWAFWDASRNRSGKWCDMSVCGNRTKARNYRRRHGGAD